MNLFASIPSPTHNGFYIGPLYFHVYGIMYVFAVAAAILISRRRWAREGGDPELVYEAARWGFPAGLIGGRIYFLITTPSQIPDHWWGPFAIWDGGLGIWGGIAGGVAVGVWRLRRQLSWSDVKRFMDAGAPGLIVAQAIGRIGNYFNQELFGKPSTLPWAVKIAPQYRPAAYSRFATFQPSFLYEIIFDLGWAAFIVWLGHHRKIKAPGLFALYVAGYCGYRIFEEQIRIDYSVHILGMRLNFWVATIGFLAAIAWFLRIQLRKDSGSAGGSPPARPKTEYSRSGSR
jgi:prolipoprotein diacylglyceryl transferase